MQTDLTNNLKSLKLENNISIDWQQDLYLRYFSHARSISATAHATYFVRIISELRQNINDVIAPSTRYSKRLQEDDLDHSLKIGIIGFGKLGKQLYSCLTSYGRVRPDQVYVSTPRFYEAALPTNTTRCFDNKLLASECDILFVCVIFQQLAAVFEEILPHLSSEKLLYNFASVYSLDKLKSLLPNFSNIIQPLYKSSIRITTAFDKKVWPYLGDVCSCLARKEVRLLTSLLHTQDPRITVSNDKVNVGGGDEFETHGGELSIVHNSQSLIQAGVELLPVMIYHYLNECTRRGLDQDLSTRIVSKCLTVVNNKHKSDLPQDVAAPGQTPNLILALRSEDFLFNGRMMGKGSRDSTEHPGTGNIYNLPVFNLCQAANPENSCNLLLKLHRDDIRRAFVKKYNAIFEEYLAWKKWHA